MHLDFEKVSQIVSSTAKSLIQNADFCSDSVILAVEKRMTASDVAQVRISEDEMDHKRNKDNDNDDDYGDTEVNVNEPSIPVSHFGVLASTASSACMMGSALQAVRNMVEADAPIQVPRDSAPMNEFENNSSLLQKVFWYHFPLNLGIKETGTLSLSSTKHLMMHYSNRFATDKMFIFVLADQQQRHAVARAVSARVKIGPDSFETFTKIVAADDFNELLQKAVATPTGKEASEIMKRVVPFITLSGNKVPWGAIERQSLVTEIIALSRRFGPASVFLTISPDDVHHPTCIRLCCRSNNNTSFPATDDGFIKHLRTQREMFSTQMDVSNAALKKLAAENPVATIFL